MTYKEKSAKRKKLFSLGNYLLKKAQKRAQKLNERADKKAAKEAVK